MEYRNKVLPGKVVQAITFDELVAYGKARGAELFEGLPVTFEYAGHQITLEKQERYYCHYLIETARGTLRMHAGEFLVTDVGGNITLHEKPIFLANYEAM